MSLQIYKPNSKNTGSAFTFQKSTDAKSGAPVFYISAISQFSWDDSKKTGSFSGNAKNPQKTINVKISEIEAGSFVSAFNTRYEYTAFHSFDGNSTTIKFTPWDKSTKISKYNPSSKTYDEDFINIPAFGITLSKGKGNSIKIALDPGEVEVVKNLFEIFIRDSLEYKIQQSANSYAASKGNPQKTKSKEEETSEEFEDVPF
tara:strand:+ start:3355 stop:3960 length:606 start_codon:yes stop_codon:yes gene_type:complete